MNQNRTDLDKEFDNDLEFRVRLRVETEGLRDAANSTASSPAVQEQTLTLLGTRLAALWKEGWTGAHLDSNAESNGIRGWWLNTTKTTNHALILRSDGALNVADCTRLRLIDLALVVIAIIAVFVMGSLGSMYYDDATELLKALYVFAPVIVLAIIVSARPMIGARFGVRMIPWQEGMAGYTSVEMANILAHRIENALAAMEKAAAKRVEAQQPRDPERYEQVVERLDAMLLSSPSTETITALEAT